MPLSLQSRDVGEITVVQCSGRIVEGVESAALKDYLAARLPHYPCIVLNLAGVQFLDSAGLGLLARILTTARHAHGDLKLCAVPDKIVEVLRITNLRTIFESYPSEEDAIAAFYQTATSSTPAYQSSREILHVETSEDVLAYVRHLLGQAGYGVTSAGTVPDALVLLKAMRPKVVIMGTELRAARHTQAAQALNALADAASVIELPADFSRDDAGDAGRQLLDQLRVLLAAR